MNHPGWVKLRDEGNLLGVGCDEYGLPEVDE